LTKFLTVIGARPQFIKCAVVSRVLRKTAEEVLVHTGQHYDPMMNDVFFAELDIPSPDYNLEIGSGSHGEQTGRMLEQIERVLKIETPDCVLVYGDTNSTIAGALAAVKLHIPVAHVEAGLRSFNRQMPEEINRLVTDQISSFLFCPTVTAVDHLRSEGIRSGVHMVGDVMYDALMANVRRADAGSILKKFGVETRGYVLATIHRPANTDSPAALARVCRALRAVADSGKRVLFPAHPRTCARLEASGMREVIDDLLIPPASYLESLSLQGNAALILTDSGGVQKEAYWLRVPCVTLREDTEWVETLASGWNVLVGNDVSAILSAVRRYQEIELPPANITEDGQAANRISSILCSAFAGKAAETMSRARATV
jgi:UDP-GlcNAc3NAcA epimerase